MDSHESGFFNKQYLFDVMQALPQIILPDTLSEVLLQVGFSLLNFQQLFFSGSHINFCKGLNIMKSLIVCVKNDQFVLLVFVCTQFFNCYLNINKSESLLSVLTAICYDHYIQWVTSFRQLKSIHVNELFHLHSTFTQYQDHPKKTLLKDLAIAFVCGSVSLVCVFFPCLK